MKKGQVTIYIILGILLLIVIASAITITIMTSVKQIEVEKEKVVQEISEGGQIKIFIESCLEKSTKKGLKEIGLKGGYNDVPLSIIYGNASYWFVDQINIQPSLETIKKRLESFIEKDIKKCLNYSTFVKQGFIVEENLLKSEITFERANTQSKLKYLITIKKGSFEKEFDNFVIELKVPFREMFETASQIINLQMDVDFKRFYPLENLNITIVEVSYSQPEENILIYIIKEKEVRENEEYPLIFASKFGPSYLKKSISLQDKSNVVSTVLPLILSSIDKMIKLIITPGTTVNLNGAAVKEITVQQSYPESVTRENVPFIEKLDDSVEYGNLTWNLTYPLYQFEPSGMRFNDPQRLIIHWDENHLPRIGRMGILYFDETGWRPLPSKANYDENYIYTDLPGWGSPQTINPQDNFIGAAISGLATIDPQSEAIKPKITAVDCGKQVRKSVSTSAKIDPGGGCFAKLGIMIVVIIILIVIMIVTFGAAGPAEVAALAAYQSTLAATGSIELATTAAEIAALTALEASVAAGPMTSAAAIAAASAAATAASAGTLGSVFITGGAAAASFWANLGAVSFAGWGLAVGGALVGGMLLSGAMAFGAGHDSISFTPTCDQTIDIHLSENGGSGGCSPSGEIQVSGGEPVSIKSQIRKCSFIRGMICIDCSIKCGTRYK